MASDIRAGLSYVRTGKVWRIKELRLAFRKFVAEATDGDVQHVDVDQFRQEWSDGDVVLLVPAAEGGLRPVPADWRQRKTPNAKAAKGRRDPILRLEAEAVIAGDTLKEAAVKIAALCQKNKWKVPSERTLRNWRQRARQHESLIAPDWDRCGNRRQGPDELLLQAMEAVFDATMATTDRFTIAGAWKLVVPKYEQLCQAKGQPIGRHSIRKLTRYLSRMHWKEDLLAKLDGRTAQALTRKAIALHTAELFWDVVEMDACLLNIFIRDEDGVCIGRPIMYLAVDVATGYVVGIHITILKPSVTPFVDCLRYMYFPKPEGFDEKYGIKHRIEVFGKPVLLTVDNGSEFIGETALAVVRELLGDSARCKPMTPQEKPHVERLNSTIKEFVRTLPGASTSSVTDEPRILPANEVLLTLEELLGRLLRFIYDDHALQPNKLRSWKSRKAVSPLDIWKEMRSAHLEPLPVSREEFEMAMYFKRDSRILQHDGIAYEGFKYHSRALGALYDAIGSCSVNFLYSDHDAEMIYVLPRDDGPPVKAHAKELDGLRVDRETATAMRAYLKEMGRELTRRAYQQRLAELEEHQKTAKSMRGRNEQARVDEKMKKARKATGPTMPTPASPPGAAQSASAAGWDFDAGSKLGRGRGGQ